jgi:hypothetical protein
MDKPQVERIYGIPPSIAIDQTNPVVLDARLLSDTDQRDLRILLRRGTARYSSLWTLLLRLFYSTVSRWTGRSR